MTPSLAATDQIAYLVDMAKADALELLGETRKAVEMVDSNVYADTMRE